MNIQMIFCRYCGGRSQKEYLFLTCRHLSCLACAFLRADFTTQEVECCGEVTKIDDQSMETIIRSKRFLKHIGENKQNKSLNTPENVKEDKQLKQSQILREKKINNYNFQQGFKAMKKDKENSKAEEKKQIVSARNQASDETDKQMLLADISKYSGKIQNSDIKKEVTQYREQIQEEDQFQLESILMRHLEKAKRHFEAEKQALKQREEAALKHIISNFEKEKKAIERPITQAVLQKFNLSLSRKTPYLSTGNSNLQINEEKNEPRESYDHILKRLELNQQRMRQKIQKHLEVLY